MMTPKKKKFVCEYLVDLNATQAAIRSGYSKRTAKSQGQRLLTDVDVASAIAAGKKEREDVTKIDAEFVLINLAEMIKADPCDIIDENGCYKPIHEWSLVWRRMLSAADVQEIYEGYGEDRTKIGEIVKYKFIDKLKAFELPGKHVDVQAYNEKKTIEHVGDVADRLTRGRNRAPAKDHRDNLH